MTKELAKYQIVFSKSIEKANLIHQKLKKRRNRLEKKLRSWQKLKLETKEKFSCNSNFKKRVEKQRCFFIESHRPDSKSDNIMGIKKYAVLLSTIHFKFKETLSRMYHHN